MMLVKNILRRYKEKKKEKKIHVSSHITNWTYIADSAQRAVIKLRTAFNGDTLHRYD